jgi:hypothetical protein
MAIICRCRLLSFLAKGESAVACAAVATSNTFPLAPTTPFGVAYALGSRLKLSHTLRGKLSLCATPSSYTGCVAPVKDEPGDELDPSLLKPFSAMFSAIETICCGTSTATDREIELV